MIATRNTTLQPSIGGGNPPVFLDLGVATLDGIIPVENLPVGTAADTVAAGDDPRFPASPSAIPSLGHEVWIAPDRNDGNPGDGTLASPYDGSTQTKFDALLTDDTKVPAHTVIHLLPGTYTTKGSAYGSAGVALKEGWIIRGAGMGLTTLFLEPIPSANYARHFSPLSAPLSRIEIHDLTLDGNVQNQPLNSLMQADISCNHGGYYRVRLTNWGNVPTSGIQEAFGLVCSMLDTGSHEASCEIRDCVVDAAVYAGGTSLGFNADGTEGAVAFVASGIIDGNTVYDNFTTNGIALAGRFRGVRVTHNRVVRATRGFHQDTAPLPGSSVPSQDVRVEGNYFEACQVMVGLGSEGNSLIHNYSIANNTHTLVDTHHGVGGYGDFTPVFVDSGVTGTIIAGNRIGISAADVNPAYAETIVFWVGAGCGDVTIIDNIVDPSLVSGASINPANGTQLIACWGNRYANGTEIPNLPDQSPTANFGNATVDGSVSVAREVFRSGDLAYNNGDPQSRYRLLMNLSIVGGTYSAHIPAYLIRASTDEGKGYTALVCATRSYLETPPQFHVVLLQGDGLLYDASTLTYLGGTVSFAVCKAPAAPNVEIHSFTVTQIGVTDKYSTTTWTTAVEDPAGAVAQGTATPNVSPLLPSNGDGSRLQNVAAASLRSVSSLPTSATLGQVCSDGTHAYCYLPQGGSNTWKQLDN